MDIESGVNFFNKHKSDLFVPFIGIGLSTATPYSIFSNHSLPFAFLVAVLSCLAAALLIYFLVLLAAMIDDISASIFNIHISWIFGVACFSIFVAKGAVFSVVVSGQGNLQIANIEGAARLLAILLIGVLLMQIQNSKAEKAKRNSEIRLDIRGKSKKEEPCSG